MSATRSLTESVKAASRFFLRNLKSTCSTKPQRVMCVLASATPMRIWGT
jgi:hypothetical protein